jgi:hypothetical protein
LKHGSLLPEKVLFEASFDWCNPILPNSVRFEEGVSTLFSVDSSIILNMSGMYSIIEVMFAANQ